MRSPSTFSEEMEMNILAVSTGVPGHVNPLIAAARIRAKHRCTIAVQESHELKPLVEMLGLGFLPETQVGRMSGDTFKIIRSARD
jgi:hypothetical protein